MGGFDRVQSLRRSSLYFGAWARYVGTLKFNPPSPTRAAHCVSLTTRVPFVCLFFVGRPPLVVELDYFVRCKEPLLRTIGNGRIA